MEKLEPIGTTHRSFLKYAAGVILILLGIYSQYLFNMRGLIYGTLVVYVLPSFIIYLLDGKRILSNSFKNLKTALRFGLGYFGIFSVAGLALAFFLLAVLFAFNPEIMDMITKPNPLLDITPDLAMAMVWFSFIVVGPFEEFLFRGFVFGGLADILKGKHWIYSALASSLIFSIIHLYYLFVFGIASIIQFSQITLFSLGMCGAYYKSGGNLIIPALIHGAYDATSFLIIALPENPFLGLELKISMIVAGFFVGVFYALGKR
ncbi:MAG: type II CAAX endopeptidase family protein [Nitrososphaeria archaeon]